ncbi:hypothetical protein MRX96_023390 [Rhipicephalus microplus]
MKLSSVTVVIAAILVIGAMPSADSMFLSSLALLPISAIVSLGGVGGLKLAITMKLLGLLGWWDISHYGVGLRASVENNKLHARVMPKPQILFSGQVVPVPIALLPHVVGGPRVKTAPGSSFLPKHSSCWQIKLLALIHPKSSFPVRASLASGGTNGATVHASGELKTPHNQSEHQEDCHFAGNIEKNPRIIKEAIELVRDLDTDRCMLRLSCEVSADPSRYGTYGQRVVAFMNGVRPLGRHPTIADFEKAYNKGRSGGVPGCIRAYSRCKYDLAALVALVEYS